MYCEAQKCATVEEMVEGAWRSLLSADGGREAIAANEIQSVWYRLDSTAVADHTATMTFGDEKCSRGGISLAYPHPIT